MTVFLLHFSLHLQIDSFVLLFAIIYDPRFKCIDKRFSIEFLRKRTLFVNYKSHCNVVKMLMTPAALHSMHTDVHFTRPVFTFYILILQQCVYLFSANRMQWDGGSKAKLPVK